VRGAAEALLLRRRSSWFKLGFGFGEAREESRRHWDGRGKMCLGSLFVLWLCCARHLDFAQ
jgi:hypothetical protein